MFAAVVGLEVDSIVVVVGVETAIAVAVDIAVVGIGIAVAESTVEEESIAAAVGGRLGPPEDKVGVGLRSSLTL